MITFAWDIWLGNGQIAFLHFTNIAVHFLCFIVALIFVYQIARTQLDAGDQSRVPFRALDVAIWVAAIWALNPVQTNAVTYLVQRMTSLCTLFFLLSMICFIAGRTRARQGKTAAVSYFFYSLSGLSTLLAFLCKENSAMIPVAIVLTECWFFQPDLPARVVGYCRRHWIVTGAVLMIGVSIVFKVGVGLIGGFEGRHFTAIERLLTESRVVVWYLSVLLWPDPSRLSLEHDIALSTSLFHPATTVLSTFLLAFLFWWTVSRRKRYPLVTYGLMWFFMNLAIESTIVPLELVFEHRMHLPSLGLFLAVVSGAHCLILKIPTLAALRELRVITWCIVGIVASALTVMTHQRNETWHDPVTLSADDAVKNPDSPRAHANYAVALSRVGRCDEATEEASTALRLGRKHYEEYGVAVNTIMICYQTSGQSERIVEEGKRFIEGWPGDADVYTLPSIYLYIARAQQELGKTEEAFASARTALAVNRRMSMQIPDFEKACVALLERIFSAAREKDIDFVGMEEAKEKRLGSKFWVALQLFEKGYEATAERFLREAASIDANHAVVCKELLTSLEAQRQMNRLQQSKWSFVKKYVHSPVSRFNACMAISYLVREHKLPSCFRTVGEICLDYALRLEPESCDAHLLKGWYYFERNQVNEALLAANKALQIDPNYAKAWMGLGFFLTKGPHPGEAVSAFSKALELYPGYPQRSSIIGIMNSLQNDA
jgi:protein O-mannosyl-transferase